MKTTEYYDKMVTRLQVEVMNAESKQAVAEKAFCDERAEHIETRRCNRLLFWATIALIAFGGVMTKTYTDQKKQIQILKDEHR